MFYIGNFILIIEEKKITKDGIKSTRISESKEWHFHSKEREKTLVIMPTSIFVNFLTYNSYEKLKQEFLEVNNKFFELFKETQVSRLGLRYINEITLDEKNPLDWETYLNKDIICLINFVKEKEALSRVFSTIEMNYAGGLKDEITIPDKDTSGYRTEESYKLLEEDGITYPEADVGEGQVLIGKTSPPKFLSEAREIPVRSKKDSRVT